jgi:ribosome recycling factor
VDPKAVTDARAKMKAGIDHLAGEYRGLRSGRATPALVENIRVDYYGSPTPIGQLAQIQVPEPRQLAIKPYDQGALKEIEKAIQASNLGINPQNDGKILRLTVPMLSEDQRKKLVGRLKEMAEQAKISLRNSRRDANKHLDEDKALTDDQVAKAKEAVQNLLKQSEGDVEKMLATKTKEIMES